MSKARQNVDKLRHIVNIREFGAKGDGVTNDTQALAAALASLAPNGGALYIPAGTYVIWRGVGGFTPVIQGVSTDNIVCDNVLIYGDGAATKFLTFNYLGQTPNNSGNEFYNVFQAQNRSNITIRDMSFSGYAQPASFWNCTNVSISGILDDAQLVQNVSKTLTVTNITQATPPTITYTGTDPSVGEEYRITGVSGMTEINGKYGRAININTTAKTFQLASPDLTISIPAAGYSAYTSGGTATLQTNYMRDKSLRFDKCKDVRVFDCKFLNFLFGVYFFGDASTRSERCIVTNCHFEHTTPAFQGTAAFPCAVYWVYVDDAEVSNCTFVDIYSTQVSGNTGIGQGYAIYEGDGASTNGVISNNTFLLRSKSNLTGIPILINEMQACAITGNTFDIRSGVVGQGGCLLLDSKNQNTEYTISGNVFDNKSNIYSISISSSNLNTTRAPTVNITSNAFRGGLNAIRIDYMGNGKYSIVSNTIRETTSASIQITGVYPSIGGSTTIPHKNILIANNHITKSQLNGILLNAACVQTQILGNTILDGNLSNQAGDPGAAISLSSYSYGSTIVGNTIGNTPHGGGLFTFGVTNAASASDRIFKDITANNTFYGLGSPAQFRTGRFFTSAPTNGVYDIQRGDFVQNHSLSAGGVPGWFVVATTTPDLSSNASSASTTVTVSSTSGMLAGDVVLLTKKKNMYDDSYYTATEWHVDTIASVTDGTNFVLTTGIPAGDGTYTAGTAGVYTARFKAAAAVAA